MTHHTRREFMRATAGVGACTLFDPLSAISQQQPLDGHSLWWPPNQALPRFPLPHHLDVADISPGTSVTPDQQVLLTTLQGIVNRRQPRLYWLLSGNNTDQLWLDTIRVPNTVAADPMSLVAKYRSEVEGAIIYDPSFQDSINIATSLAGILSGVATTAEFATEYQLPSLMDLRGLFSTNIEAYSWLLDNYWSQLSHRLLVGISPQTPDLRDYIVAIGAMVFWLDPTVPDEAAVFVQILGKVAPDTPYLGWFVNGNENAGVQLCSQNAVVVLAADYLDNATVLGGVRAPIRPLQPMVEAPSLDNKIYVTLTMSDGDNLQFDEHQLRNNWDDPGRGKIAINWSIDPLLIDVAPAMLNYYQSTQTQNDFLVSGPSGAGYTFPSQWPTTDFSSFTKRTGALMKRAGLNVIYVLNRVNGANADLTDGIAQAYLDDVHPLGILGNLVDSNHGTLLSTPAGLPVMNQIGIATVAEGQAVLRGIANGWGKTSPKFVAIGLDAWDLTPTAVNTLVTSLGSDGNDFEFVRADVFFQLLKQTVGDS